MEIIQFKIQHIDPMGQGVHKENGQIYFIPKTLPGEEGSAKIVNKSKGVNFCELTELTKSSPLRVSSPCPHFDKCQGCHFLHTDYENELEIKKEGLKRILSPFSNTISIKVSPSPNRFATRNRIQLHYDAPFKRIGFINKNSKEIINVQNCLLPEDPIQKELKNIYEKVTNKDFFPKHKPKGHVELYLSEEKVVTSWNRPYSDGGFTQVNSKINEILQQQITSIVDKIIKDQKKNSLQILDLFGGSGNLSKNLVVHKCLIYDTIINKSKLKEHQKGHILNLSNNASFKLILDEIKNEFTDLIIIDPPRSGFKNISEVLKFNSPYIIYVSCSPQTLKRDLLSISNDYDVQEIGLLDMFPGTFHFETFVFLKKK